MLLDGLTVAVRVTGPTGGVGLGLSVTVVADDELEAAPITMFDALLTALVSCDVATLNVAFGYVPTPVFVIPGIDSVPVVDPASAQPAERVTVATFPLTKSFDDGQLTPKPLKVTDCPVAIMKFGLNTTLMVLEGNNAPDGEVVSPTVQVELAFAAVEPAEKVALVGDEADAASTEKVAIRPPSAKTPIIEPMSRLRRRCSRLVNSLVAC